MGHVFADRAVAPGCAAHQHAVLVRQRHRQTVELELAHQVEVGALDQVRDAAVPGHELVVVERVAQAEKWRRVSGLGETLGGLGAHSLRRRVGGDEVGVLLFQPAELAHQVVVLGVADLRLVEREVEMVVTVDLGPERLDALYGRGWFGHARCP